MAKQFVAWARVSSARQKKEGFSLEDQEQRLNEYAARLGGTVIKLFKIAETASKRDERKTFGEFTTYVKRSSRRLAGMLFVKVDRAARNLRDWADLEALSEETKVPLFFPDQPTAETAAGRMQRRMSAVFASYQTDQQATDIRAGHKRRVESGLPLGRQYGYRLVRINGRSIVELDPIQAPKVKRIFELFAYQTLTIESLITTLARQGIIYTDRNPKWTKSTLHRLLHNRSYIGEVSYQGLWYPGRFEALVDRETFQIVHEKFGTDFKVCRQPELTYAGGLMTCAHCGRVVTGEMKHKTSPDGTKRQYSYYRCSGMSAEGHPRVRLTEAEIDNQLLALFASIRLEDPESREWFVDVIRSRASEGQADNKQHRDELKRQHELVETKLSTLLEMRMNGEVNPKEYAAKRAELHDRQSALRVQLEVTDRDDREIADLAIKAFELSQSLNERWLTADYNAKRTILSIMLETVRLNSENVEFSLRKPFNLLRDETFVPLIGATGNRNHGQLHFSAENAMFFGIFASIFARLDAHCIQPHYAETPVAPQQILCLMPAHGYHAVGGWVPRVDASPLINATNRFFVSTLDKQLWIKSYCRNCRTRARATESVKPFSTSLPTNWWHNRPRQRYLRWP